MNNSLLCKLVLKCSRVQCDAGWLLGFVLVISTGLLDKGAEFCEEKAEFGDCFHRHFVLELRKYHTLLLLASGCLLSIRQKVLHGNGVL